METKLVTQVFVYFPMKCRSLHAAVHKTSLPTCLRFLHRVHYAETLIVTRSQVPSVLIKGITTFLVLEPPAGISLGSPFPSLPNPLCTLQDPSRVQTRLWKLQTGDLGAVPQQGHILSIPGIVVLFLFFFGQHLQI